MTTSTRALTFPLASLSLVLLSSTLGCAGGEVDDPPLFTASGADEVGTAETETETASESGSDSGSDADADSGAEADSDADSGTGTDSTTESESESDTTDEDSSDTGAPECGRSRYTYSLAQDSWTAVPLDSVWTGPNAPPCDVEILATTYIEPWDQLFVFSADDNFYHRVSGTWEAPQSTAATFPMLSAEFIASLHSIPPVDEETSELTFAGDGVAYLFTVFEDGSVTYKLGAVLNNDSVLNGGPAQADDLRSWSAVICDPEIVGVAGWWRIWARYTDNKIYHVNADFSMWQQWPQDDSPMFSGQPNQPSAATLEAGWGSLELDRIYLVGP